MELQDQLGALRDRGLGVAAISYDSEAVLADFAERRGITFPLLADDDSTPHHLKNYFPQNHESNRVNS